MSNDINDEALEKHRQLQRECFGFSEEWPDDDYYDEQEAKLQDILDDKK